MVAIGHHIRHHPFDGLKDLGMSDAMVAPIVKLRNGIVVANFSSPHQFTFDDGTVLAACSAERSKFLMLEAVETEVPNGRWTDIVIRFNMSENVRVALNELCGHPGIDIVLIPFPVMTALKEAGVSISKFRVVRVADRVTKVIHSDKFCI